tara:strand:+ start:98 stop:610 length:513 start_codon:yes stop_codon:yes gene_type:complete
MSVTDKVWDLASPLCANVGVELVDIELNGGILKIVIDQMEGLNTEVLAEVTRDISRELDHQDPLPGSYTLEITSPGLERTLKKPEHFIKAVGNRISVKKVPGLGGDRRLEGNLLNANEFGISVQNDDGLLHEVLYEEVQKAKTVFVWESDTELSRQTGKKENTLNERKAS